MANDLTVVLSKNQILKFDKSSTELTLAGISSLTVADINLLVWALEKAPGITKLIVPSKIVGGGRAVFNLLCENHTITEIEYGGKHYRDVLYDVKINKLLVKNRTLLSLPDQVDELLKEKKEYVEAERRNLKALDTCTNTILKLISLGLIVDLYNIYHTKEPKSLTYGHATSIGMYSVANAIMCGILATAPSLFKNREAIENGNFFRMMQGGAMSYCATTFCSTYIYQIESPYTKCAVTLLGAAVMSACLIYRNREVNAPRDIS